MDSTEQTPLSFAAESGSTYVVHLLLTSDDVKVNSTDNDGQKPLSFAAARNSWQEGSKEIVELLLRCDDVQVDSADKNRQTLLLFVAQSGAKNVVQLLLTHDNVPSGFNKQRWTDTSLICSSKKFMERGFQ